MFMRLTCHALLFGLLPAISWGQEEFSTVTTDSPMVVSYHRDDANDTQNRYQFDLIEMALEITRAEFGDYVLRPYSGAPTAKRQSILLSQGKLMNIQWASPGTPIAQADVTVIPVNILHGLLGLRLCLVNREQLPRFANIHSLDDLRQIRIGQGQDWTDTLIYKLNGVPLLEAVGLPQLFPILATRRFDCLALGANELLVKYAEQQETYPEMVIEPGLLLYYDFPTYLYVSRRHPQLAERITLGLQKLQASGADEQLFWRYFARKLAPLNLDKRRIICLKSPYLPAEEQCREPIILPALTPPPEFQSSTPQREPTPVRDI